MGLPKIVLFGLVLMALVAVTVSVSAQTQPGEDALRAAQQKAVEQRRLKLETAIEKDGFFSARIALNLWRREAQEAGLFDEDTYDQYKRKLYNISIDQNRRCYEFFLIQGSLGNAEACLKIWRLHAKEVDQFNPDDYETMVEKLRQAKEQAAREKQRKEE